MALSSISGHCEKYQGFNLCNFCGKCGPVAEFMNRRINLGKLYVIIAWDRKKRLPLVLRLDPTVLERAYSLY